MYEIKRENGRVIIYASKGNVNDPIYNAPENSYIIYQQGGIVVSKVKDLPDEQLLQALAQAIILKF